MMMAKVAKNVLMGILASSLLAATAAEPPLARLSSGETVSKDDFNTYLSRRTDLKPLVRNYWGAENALKEMLMTRVLVLEGLRLKEPSRASEKPDRFDDIYGHAVYRQLVKTCPSTVDEASGRKFYAEHPEVFTAPPSVRLARVMLPVSEKVDGAPSMAWLLEQAQDIAKGTKNFDQVVKRAESIYKLEIQGDLGWVNLAGDVTIMRALAGANPGEMVGPVRDGDFAYLFLLGDKRPSRVAKWEEVRASAGRAQINFCREQANKELTNKLFKQYGVTIDHNAIKALFNIPVRPGGAPATSTAAASKPAGR